MNDAEHLKQLEGRFEGLRERVSKLEGNHNLYALTEKHMNSRFDQIEKSLEGIRGTITKVNWIVIAAVLAAVMKLLLTGDVSVTTGL